MKKTKFEIAVLNFVKEKKYLILIVFSLAVSLMIQNIGLTGPESGDWIGDYSKWVEALKNEGLTGEVTIYPAGFNLILLFLIKIGAATNVGFKWVSYFFQIIIAVVFFAIVLLIKKRKESAAYAFSISLLCPSLVFNTSSWGQVDAIYVALCMCAILCYILKKRKKFKFGGYAAFAFVGLALSVKQTTLFFLPILIFIYCIDEEISFLCFLATLISYFLPSIPSLMAGCSFYNALIEPWVSGQSIAMGVMVANFTNVYALFPSGPFWSSWVTNPVTNGIGNMLCLALLAVIFLYSLNKNVVGSKTVLLGIVFVVIFCCTMPGIHERYMLLADLLSILYCFVSNDPKKWQIAVFINFVSFFNVMNYLQGCVQEISNTRIVIVEIVSLAFVAFTAWLIKHYMWELDRIDHNSLVDD